MKRRTGRALTIEERTCAVLRAMNGEDHGVIATEFRVREVQVRLWIKEWNHRDGNWSHMHDRLLPMEILAGYDLGDELPHPKWTGHSWRGPMKRKERSNDPTVVAETSALARSWFLELLSNLPPDSLDQHIRAWQALDDRARDLFSAAWDAYQLAASALGDAKRQIARAHKMATDEIDQEHREAA